MTEDCQQIERAKLWVAFFVIESVKEAFNWQSLQYLLSCLRRGSSEEARLYANMQALPPARIYCFSQNQIPLEDSSLLLAYRLYPQIP